MFIESFKRFTYRKKLFLFLFILSTAFFGLQKFQEFKLYKAVSRILIAVHAVNDEAFFRTQFEIIKSYKTASEAEQQINKKLKSYNNKYAQKNIKLLSTQDILTAIDVDIDQEANIIKISAKHKNSTIAKLICNIVTKIFVKYDYKSRYKAEATIAQELEKELIPLKKSLDESIKALSSLKQNHSSNQYQDLLSEIEHKQKMYSIMLRNIKEAEINKMMTYPYFKVLDRATISKTSEQIYSSISWIIILSICIALCITLFLEINDNTIKSTSSIRRKLKLPIMGTVPHFKIKLIAQKNLRLRETVKESTKKAA